MTLNPADPNNNTLGSLVYIEIDSSSVPSVVSVTGPATLAGVLEFQIDSNAQPGTYTILTSSEITGTFDSVTFAGPTPNYTLSYITNTNPMSVQFDFLGFGPNPPSNLQGKQKKNDFWIRI